MRMTELPLPDSCICRGDDASGAVFSAMESYRYVLWRVWENCLPSMVWCMLNPSTASELEDDATIRKCKGFATRLSFGGIVVVNLFGFRARDPVDLGLMHMRGGSARAAGEDNDVLISTVTDFVGNKRLWCGWGASLPSLVRPRVEELRPLLLAHSLLCLGTSRDGSPRHPLMLSYREEPRPWMIPSTTSA